VATAIATIPATTVTNDRCMSPAPFLVELRDEGSEVAVAAGWSGGGESVPDGGTVAPSSSKAVAWSS
jgi:hypothetical protein